MTQREAKRRRTAREAAGFSDQEALARAAGLSLRTINTWERGSVVKPATEERIEAALLRGSLADDVPSLLVEIGAKYDRVLELLGAAGAEAVATLVRGEDPKLSPGSARGAARVPRKRTPPKGR